MIGAEDRLKGNTKDLVECTMANAEILTAVRRIILSTRVWSVESGVDEMVENGKLWSL